MGIKGSALGVVFAVCAAGCSNGVKNDCTEGCVAPDTTIASGPVALGISRNAVFELACSVASCTFECSVDGADFARCSATQTFDVTDGRHTLLARAVSRGLTDATPASWEWTVDATPPETTIDSGPSALEVEALQTFTFSCNEGQCAFQCSVDGAIFAPCTSPYDATFVEEGTHAFAVQAQDAVGLIDPTPASLTFDLDLAPQTTITSAPLAMASQRKATIAFTCDVQPCTFECRFDGDAWTTCTSPRSFTDVTNGAHRFEVRARDAHDRQDPSPAIAVFEISAFISISATANATCGVRANHTLWCWGFNGGGRLGVPNLPMGAVPEPTRVGSDSTWQSVTLGELHLCATRTNGTLWCGGLNIDGQLGIASAASSAALTQVGTDTSWTEQVAVGSNYTCAVKSDGSLWCWGGNSSGQLGDGTTAAARAPRRVGTDANWAGVATGSFDTCAWKTDGAAWCSASGEVLGVGTGATLAGSPGWSRIVKGTNHACGIRNGGELWCFGSGAAVGTGTGSAPTPARIGAASSWTDVSAHNTQTCGLLDGTMWCWGDNTYGQSKGVEGADALVPTQIGSRTDWSTVSSGGSHDCGTLASGELSCWGYDHFAQLGDHSFVSRYLHALQVGTQVDWVDVSNGFSGVCGVRSGGTLWCWGRNLLPGRLFSQTPIQVDSATTWQRVSRGGSHACGLRSDRTLWCWGDGYPAGTTGGGTVPPTQIGTASDWVTVAAGDNHNCGLRDGGSVWCWGSNTYGQLGNGGTTPSATPTQVAGVWDAVTVNRAGGCALHAGELWCWGSTGGNGNAPTRIGTATDWATIARSNGNRVCGVRDGGLYCGATTATIARVGSDNDWGFVEHDEQVCGIRDDDSLWCFGGNTYGEVGDGTSVDRPLPVRSGDPGATWGRVSAAYNVSCGIRLDGSLWCWGDDPSGQLGHGLTWKPSPVISD